MNKPELSLETINKMLEYIDYILDEIKSNPEQLANGLKCLKINLKFEKMKKEEQNVKKGL